MSNSFLEFFTGSPRNNSTSDNDSTDSANDSVPSHHDPDDDWLPEPDSPTTATDIAVLTASLLPIAIAPLVPVTTAASSISDPATVPITNAPTAPDPPDPLLPQAPPPPTSVLVNNADEFYYFPPTMTSSTVYPVPELTVIEGTPNAENLRKLTEELENNAKSVNSDLGGGSHGHLGLLHTATSYNVIVPNAPWILPPPAVLPTTADYTAIGAPPAAALILAYNEVKETRAKAFATENELRRQLIAAIDPTYLNAHAELHGGIGNRSTLQILVYLRETYGKTTTADRQKNEKRLDNPFNPSEPIENFWRNINATIAFAKNAEHPIDDTVTILRVLLAFEKDGHFAQECKAWRLKPEAQWIVADFITDISAVHKLATETAGTAGYHGANAAKQTTPNSTATNQTTTSVPRRNQGGTAVFDGRNPTAKVTASYCWSCGVHNTNNKKSHYSDNCPAPLPGHDKNATIFDRRGGNATFHPGRAVAKNSASAAMIDDSE